MVGGLQISAVAGRHLLLAQKSVPPALERMDPPQRAAVIMALLALTLIGLFLIVFAMVGGHWVRRLARHRPGQSSNRRITADTNDTHLRQSLESVLPEAKTDDTIQYGKSSPDTKAGG